MTSDEKQLIQSCRIVIIGSTDFFTYIKDELTRFGFSKLIRYPENTDNHNGITSDIQLEFIDAEISLADFDCPVPVICSFDFIAGAGAIVTFPGDDRSFLHKPGLRLRAAKYMAGYCAFWNIGGCEWLLDALPAIKAGRTNPDALKTAASLCARIAANIAVGCDVKRYPRFYLAQCGSMPSDIR